MSISSVSASSSVNPPPPPANLPVSPSSLTSAPMPTPAALPVGTPAAPPVGTPPAALPAEQPGPIERTIRKIIVYIIELFKSLFAFCQRGCRRESSPQPLTQSIANQQVTEQ